MWYAGRGGDSSSDFTDLEEEEDDDEPQPKKASKPRAPRLANLFKHGNQGGRGSAEDAGAAKEGADDEMAASDHFWHGLSKKVNPVFLVNHSHRCLVAGVIYYSGYFGFSPGNP